MRNDVIGRWSVVIGIALLLSAFVVWNSAGDLSKLQEWQGGAHYLTMLHGESAPSPFGYRILVPWLCFGSTTMGYVWIILGTTLTAIGLFVLTGMVGGDRRAQWLTLLLFLFWKDTVGIASQWYILPDPLVWACLTWSAVFALKKRFVAAIAVVALGGLVREMALAALPFVLIVSFRRRVLEVALTLASIATWAMVLLLVETAEPMSINDTLSPIEMITATLRENQGSFLAWAKYWKAFYVMIPLALAGYPSLTNRRLLWLLLPIVGIFLATDTARMIVFAAPVLLPLAGMGLGALIGRLPKANAYFITGGLLIAHSMNLQDIWFLIALMLLAGLSGIAGNRSSVPQAQALPTNRTGH